MPENLANLLAAHALLSSPGATEAPETAILDHALQRNPRRKGTRQAAARRSHRADGQRISRRPSAPGGERPGWSIPPRDGNMQS